MREKVIGLFILALIGGCSVFKLQKQNYNIHSNENILQIDNNIQDENLTNIPFYIQKAEAKIIDNDGNFTKFLLSIKFHPPDSFLISIRSNTGLEAARIFITNDTILVNDRINKKVFYGSEGMTAEKYGLSIRLFPVFFGDIVSKNEKNTVLGDCKDGFIDLESVVDLYRAKYTVDCNDKRPVSIKILRGIDKKPIVIEFLNYYEIIGRHIPKKIIISNLNVADKIYIKYSKVDIFWFGKLEFNQGRNYEQIELK